MSFGKTLFYTAIHYYTSVDIYAKQLSRHSPSGVQGVCSPIPSDVPMVIWHMGDGFFEKILVNSLIPSVILENSSNSSSSVYVVFSFNYINV